MLTNTEETSLHVARRYFGPVLLQRAWLHWNHNPEALRLWGHLETDYRLITIAMADLLVAIISIGMIKTKRQQTAARSPSVVV